MALIKCEECGRMISDRAVSCPQCGCPVTKQEAFLICPECGNNVSIEDVECYNCGCPTNKFEELANYQVSYEPTNSYSPSQIIEKYTIWDELKEWCSANSHIVISLTIVFLLFAIPLGYYGIDSLINPTSNSYSESIDPKYWEGKWVLSEFRTNNGEWIPRPNSEKSLTFDATTMRVQIVASGGIEINKDWDVIPDGSGVAFKMGVTEEARRWVQILAPNGFMYSKNLDTGELVQDPFRYKHVK